MAEARRANDIPIAEIAKELHLDESKVQALEENQFDVLGAPVFAKGHLRKYADLVGVAIEDILADYYQLNRSAGAPPVVRPVRKQVREIKLGKWAAILVGIGAIALLSTWWFNRDTSEIIRTPGALEPFAAEEQAPDVEEATLEEQPAAQPAEQPLAEQPLPDDSLPTGGELANDVVPVPGESILVMVFSGDCWTEVTDANGDRLFFGLGEDGQTVRRSGVPPMRALFGDRNNVAVTIDGVDFPLPGDGRRGNTARVTIDAQ